MNSTDGDARAAAGGQRVLDAVLEQGPVGEPGQGVIERLVGELRLERLALAHVADVEDDALDVRVVEQVGRMVSTSSQSAVGVPDPELHRLAADVRGRGR